MCASLSLKKCILPLKNKLKGITITLVLHIRCYPDKKKYVYLPYLIFLIYLGFSCTKLRGTIRDIKGEKYNIIILSIFIF